MFTIASDYCGFVVLCPSVAMSQKIFKKHKISTLIKHEYKLLWPRTLDNCSPGVGLTDPS